MNNLNIDDDFSIDEEMEDLVSAEDFLNYFSISFDVTTVNTYRLHILQRYHDYLADAELPDDPFVRRDQYKRMLVRAYEDFVHSDAKTEKVLKIYKNLGPQQTFVSLDDVFNRSGNENEV